MSCDKKWPLWQRSIVSIAICAYLLLVLLPPLAGPPPASLLADRLLQPFRPFVGALALGHGYRFFAPNPGPGHSFHWSVQMSDGTRRSGTIPDARSDWPRLLYHRRFMLPEKIALLVPLNGAPSEVVVDAKREWQPLVMDIAARILEQEQGSQVELTLVEHYLPTPEDVLEGRAGEDMFIPLGTYALAKRTIP